MWDLCTSVFHNQSSQKIMKIEKVKWAQNKIPYPSYRSGLTSLESLSLRQWMNYPIPSTVYELPNYN